MRARQFANRDCSRKGPFVEPQRPLALLHITAQIMQKSRFCFKEEIRPPNKLLFIDLCEDSTKSEASYPDSQHTFLSNFKHVVYCLLCGESDKFDNQQKVTFSSSLQLKENDSQ